jgi:predicted N-acetyltransferase YhbS
MELQLRPVTPGDAPRIFALHEVTSPLEQARSWTTWEARWRWAHVENPWVQDGVPVGFVAAQGETLVGHLGLVPVPLRRGDSRFIGQASEAFLVDPTVQGQGLGRKLAQRAWDDEAVPIPVTFTATPTSTHLFEKFGALPAPLALSQRRLGVLQGSALATRLAAGAGSVGRVMRLPGARALLGGLAGAAFTLARARRRTPAGWKVAPLDPADPELAALADRCHDPRTLRVDIDARYLAWRYLDAPATFREGIQVLGMRGPDSALVALLVVEELPREDWGGRFATLMELVAPAEHRADVLALLLAYGRERRWSALRSPYLCPAWDLACSRAGFLPEARVTNRTVIKQVPALPDAASWSGDAGAYEIGMGCRW